MGDGKVIGRPFAKGVSGNPGGRTPVSPEVREALKALTMPAVKRLGELINSENERVALGALNSALDRNLGTSPLTESAGVQPEAELLERAIAALRKRGYVVTAPAPSEEPSPAEGKETH